jgi:hypothetical protein
MNHKRIVVYAASSNRVDGIYLNTAERIGRELVKNGFGIVYGGGKVGLMGRLATGALSEGGKIYGVIPDFMMELELGNNEITELLIVNSMHERQKKMIELSDAAVVLPGGSGTFMEFFELISWKRLGLVIHPIILLNINDYFNNLLLMLHKAVEEKFMTHEHLRLWNVATDVNEAIKILQYNFQM